MNPLRLSFVLLLPLWAPLATRAGEGPSYAKEVLPFLRKYCVECHNGQKPRAGLNLETAAGLRQGSDNGPVLVAGRPDESLVVVLTEKKKEPHMPPKKAEAQPTPAEAAVLRAWVQAGAKVDREVAKVTLPDVAPRVKVNAPVTALAFAPDGSRLAAGAYGRVTVFGWRDGQFTLAEHLDGLPGTVTALAWSRDGRTLAVAAGTPGAPATLRLQPVPATDTLWKVGRDVPNAHADVIQRLAFSPDGQRLVSCGYDKQVKLWDVAAGTEVKTLREHSDSVYGVAFRPDGELFATVAGDRAVKVWEAATGKLLYTLGEATDWLYAVAWSPNGKHLAAGGVDKSIRVWEVTREGGKVVRSVYGHAAPVTQLLYAPDGKTLYSAGEDRVVKAWDAARMVERAVFPAQPEEVLALALHPAGETLAVGLYDGKLLLVDARTGAPRDQFLKDLLLPEEPRPLRDEKDCTPESEPNDSPGSGQVVTLPALLAGELNKAGDTDYYRFEAKAGQPFGVRAEVKQNKGKASFDATLELTDGTGQVLARSDEDFLGYTFERDGTYALGLRDREFLGGGGRGYTLRLGDVPVVLSVFPLGLQKGSAAEFRVEGVHLGGVETVRVDAAKADAGAKLPVPLKGVKGPVLGAKQVVVGEFPEVVESPGSVVTVPTPGTANGRIDEPGETDTWRFAARKGQPLVIEVNARRLGSDLDSYIELLDRDGQPLARATLRTLANTYVAFRGHNSVQPNIRIEAWGELAPNDYIYVGSQLLKIRALPPHPDADCQFFSVRGQRAGYLDTTPTQVSKGDAMYKVEVHPPGATFPPNGFPVVTVHYRNDDGGAGFGRDSRLTFDPPADGDYLVRVGDSRGQAGSNYGYRLTVRAPRPSYNVTLAPNNPQVWRGGAIPVTVTADRIDGYDGTIAVRPEGLPPGFTAPATTIPAGENETTFALWADADAKAPGKDAKLQVTAAAVIDDREVTKEASAGALKAVDAGEIVTATKQSEITLKPGGTTRLTVTIERRKGFAARVPLNVEGLPHGVRVLDIGLNGILITEKETTRTMQIYCEPWVRPTEHPIVVTARKEGPNTPFSAKSVLLRIIE